MTAVQTRAPVLPVKTRFISNIILKFFFPASSSALGCAANSCEPAYLGCPAQRFCGFVSLQDITSDAHLPSPLRRISLSSLRGRACATIKLVAGASIARLHGRKSMGELFTPMHLIVLAVVVLVLFGGKKLPELGKGLGEGLRGFKDGMKGVTDEVNKPTETTHAVTPKPEESVK
jgi:sec-independent protein translocase protein TatA